MRDISHQSKPNLQSSFISWEGKKDGEKYGTPFLQSMEKSLQQPAMKCQKEWNEIFIS